MRRRNFSGPTCLTGAPLTLAFLLIMLIRSTHQIEDNELIKQQALNQTATSSQQTDQQQLQIATNQTTKTANLTESLNERLVKQSNLQAEESRQDEGQTVFVPAPASFNQPSQNVKRGTTFVSGGSGDSYLSMSHDGSNRYDFGFDTSRKQEQEQRPPTKRPAPRLMREESRLEDGTVIGRYGYTDPFNVFRIVQYVAGPDGYFASEDVGALEAHDSSATAAAIPGSPGPKFQLNKQLHKALEQARSLRRASNQKRSARKRSSEANLVEVGQPGSVVQPNLESARQDDEILAGSSSDHQSVRFATRINHVVGTNGITYATAFRPTQASPTMASAVSAHQTSFAHEQQQQRQQQQQQQAGSFSKPVYVSTRYEPFKSISTHHDLRSQLPAPIWSPPAEDAPYGTLISGDLNSSNQQQQQQVAASYYPPAAVLHQPIASALQSHPAWTLLNNNYNNGNYQTSLFIDHAGANSVQQQPQPQHQSVGHTFAADAHREAHLLAALKERRRPVAIAVAAPAPAPVLPASQPVVLSNNQYEPQQQVELQQQEQASSESQPTMVFGTRTATPTQTTIAQPSYNFGFALKHFDAPLYHPQVHETKPDQVAPAVPKAVEASQPAATQIAAGRESQDASNSDSRAPGFSYASTVMHSEVAAEQAYKPERLTGAAAPSELHLVDPLRSSASSRASLVAALPESAARETQQSVAAANDDAQAEKVRREEPIATAAAALSQPVAYATRLSALADDELSMEDSEQVGYLPNGTHTGQLSRARLPDRSKKLSSIFKARHGQTDHGESSAGEGGSATARIRRPVPINAKKQFSGVASTSGQFEQKVGRTSSSTPSSESDKIPRTPSEPNTASVVVNAEPVVQAAAPPKSGPASRKFGSNLRQAPPSPERPSQDDPPVPAKKRPLFVEPAAKKHLETIPILPPTFPSTTTTTTTTTTTSTTTTTEAPATSETPSNALVQEAPQAVIVDATSGLASTSGQIAAGSANRELMEKIMRIQMELASRAARLNESAHSSTNPSTLSMDTNNVTFQVNVDQQQTTTSSTTTTTTTTERPPITTIKSSSITNTTPVPTTTSSTTPSTTSTTASAPELSEPNAKSVDKLTIISDNELTSLSHKESPSPSATSDQLQVPMSAKNLLTGPLVRMVASSLDQDDFMSMSMTADSMGFDSARAVVMSNNSEQAKTVANQTQEAPTWELPKSEASLVISSSGGGNSSTSAAIPTTSAPPEREIQIPIAIASAPEVPAKPIVTTRAPQFNSTEPVDYAPQTTTTTTTPTTTSTVASVVKESHENRAAASQPSANQTQAQAQPTTTPVTSTSTSTIRPAAQRVRTTSQPARFGRLVIKRGDKVVARYNASDSIPDSMIPVSGTSGEIIMPDLPRLGMRRSLANRKRASSSGGAIRDTSTTTTTTARPATTMSLPAKEPQNVNASISASDNPDRLAPRPDGSVSVTTLVVEATSVRPTTTSGRDAATATATPTTLSRLKRKSLLRGARSPRGQAASESDGDLMNEETSPRSTSVIAAGSQRLRAGRALDGARVSNTTRQSVDSSATATAAASNRFGVRNSWSSRLRENIGRQMAEAAAMTATPTGANSTQGLPKRYDPEEDLKKLVEKIERIQFESSAGSAARDHDDVPRRFVRPSVHIDVLSPATASQVTNASTNRTSDSGKNTTVIQTTPVAANQQQQQQQVSQVATSSFSSKNKTTLPVDNIHNSLAATPGISNKTAGSSQWSSSISFTLAVSPDIESQWSKLKPVNLTTTTKNQTTSSNLQQPHLSNLITRLTSNGAQQLPPLVSSAIVDLNQTATPPTKLDIRVDSRGHIHVRNNQSITVHVDIEPPKRNSSGSSGAQKRITSRDTSAVSAMFGRDDIQRSRKQATATTATITTTTTTGGRVSPEVTSTTPAVTNPTRVSGEETAALLRRRPRMLCIEVESNDSDLLRQKRGDPMTKLQTPRFTPDAAQ